MELSPQQVRAREPLPAGYELWILSRPLPAERP